MKKVFPGVVFYIFDQTDFKATFGCFGVFGPSVFERNGERRIARSRRILVRSGRNRLVWIEGSPTGNQGRKRRKNFFGSYPSLWQNPCRQRFWGAKNDQNRRSGHLEKSGDFCRPGLTTTSFETALAWLAMPQNESSGQQIHGEKKHGPDTGLCLHLPIGTEETSNFVSQKRRP